MIPSPKTPPTTAATGPGMTVEPRPDVLLCRIQADSFRAARLPRGCEVGARLGVWDFERVVVAGLVVRVGADAALAGEYWIDGTAQQSIQILRCLAKVDQIRALLYWEGGERELFGKHSLHGEAIALLRRLEKWKKWSHLDYNAALERLRTLYPTAIEIWRDCAVR